MKGTFSSAFSEEAAVRRYLLLMHELVIRVDLIARASDGRLSLAPPYAREYCYLQFRRICELIALGCLQLHGDLPDAQTSAAKKEWNAERIMKLLHRQHPYSFPQSVTRKKLDGVWKIVANSTENALTFNEFKSLYSKCGEILHRGTIRSIEVETSIEQSEHDEVFRWSHKIVSLLNEHVVAKPGTNSLYLISLKTEKGGPACSVFSNLHEGGVQVATYDLDVTQKS